MVDLSIVRAKGLSQEDLKRYFAGDPSKWFGQTPPPPTISLNSPPTTPLTPDAAAADAKETDEQKRVKLHNRIRSRIQEGMQRNFSDYRVFMALDQAWDQPFNQISPTLVQNFINSNPNEDAVYDQMKAWGLSDMITTERDQKTGKDTRKLNLPVFFNVFVPLVRCYVEKVWAEIVNRWLINPLFKWEALKFTTPLRVQCEAITDRSQVMTNQYGYFDVLKQSVLKMLHYAFCFQFVKEEWHSESQWRKANEQDVAAKKKNAKGDVVSVGDEIKVTDREGLRYHHPHPTRLFWDMAHGKHTINYDSGCAFLGYWQVIRYRDILSASYWNKGAVSLSSADLIANHRAFFASVYSACQVSSVACLPPPPTPATGGITPSGATAVAATGGGAGEFDREKEIASPYYGNEHGDQGVLVTEYFEKLIPSENGLGTYDCPIWMRFVLAGDGCTILYAAPLPSTPAVYYGDCADESRAKNASLALKILPFQDHFGNVLTQILLTAKQNLANLTLLDEDQLEEASINKVKNIGNQYYQALNVVGFSGKRAFRGQNRITDVSHTVGFPKGNVGELTNVLKTILDVLERVLLISSQQVGQAASHEQTREEIRNIAGATGSMSQFRATPVDIAVAAWKRQIYASLMAYGDDDMYVKLPSDIPLTKDKLEKMGFTYVDNDAFVDSKDKFLSYRTTKKATAIDMWQFASTRDGEDRSSDREVAIAMSVLVRDFLNTPYASAIGPDQAIDLANRISQLAGLPRDFKLKNANPNLSDEQRKAQAQEELQQVLDAVMKGVDERMMKALEPLLEQVKRQGEEIGLIMRAMAPQPSPMGPEGNGAPMIPEMAGV